MGQNQRADRIEKRFGIIGSSAALALKSDLTIVIEPVLLYNSLDIIFQERR